MKFVSDPLISTKIRKMKERVRWQDSLIMKRGIDQTSFVLDDANSDNPQFSFLVVGDSGTGPNRHHNPQRQVAEQMLAHKEACRFTLHTGDVIYLVGSSEYYLQNFIEPYREFLVGGENPQQIAYDRMVFTNPILPVPGNHDYYDLPLAYGLLAQLTLPLSKFLRLQLDFDVGRHGSKQGNAYAQAFLDYLKALSPDALNQHLDRHYTAKTATGYCLRYQPGHFTRLPNRYYTFRYGGIDFFALDSNTFNAPIPLPTNRRGDASRRRLAKQQADLEQQKRQLLEASVQFNPSDPASAEHLDDVRTKLEQIEELELDIEKQLTADTKTEVDTEQLNWLQQRLIESWHHSGVRGRVIYFHHPPYVTEATKWHQGQTFAVRHRLRQVLDAVAEAVGEQTKGQPLVDLVLNGHAHCLEYLRTENTGHADSYVNWIVCGGSGYSLRRQKAEGPNLMEFAEDVDDESRLVARSHLFIGRNGHGLQKRRPYSFLRIDVQEGQPPKFVIRPFIAERFQGIWNYRQVDPFVI